MLSGYVGSSPNNGVTNVIMKHVLIELNVYDYFQFKFYLSSTQISSVFCPKIVVLWLKRLFQKNPHMGTQNINDLEDLQSINYENQKTSVYLRRCEYLTNAELYSILIMYIVLFITLVVLWLFSPPIILTTERIISTKDEKMFSTKKNKLIFDVNAYNISKHNYFLSYQLSVIKNGQIIDNTRKTPKTVIPLWPKSQLKNVQNFKIIPSNEANSSFLLSLRSHQYLNNSKTYDMHIPTAQYTLRFDKTSPFSETLQVLRLSEISFDKVDTHIVLKFLENSENAEHSVLFRLHRGNPLYLTFSDILSIPNFIVSLICTVNLFFKRMNGMILTNIFYLVDFCIISLLIASIPPSFLSFLQNDDILFQKIRIFQNIFIFVIACSAGILYLLLGQRKMDIFSFSSLIPGIIFFIIVFSLMGYSYIHSFENISMNSIIPLDYTYSGLSIAEYVVMLLYIFALVLINGSNIPENYVEHNIHLILSFIFTFLAAITEVLLPADTAIETCFGMKIFGYESAAIYLFFFSFLNWPMQGS